MIRPLTHDLLKNLFGTFDAKITRVEIVVTSDTVVETPSSSWGAVKRLFDAP